MTMRTSRLRWIVLLVFTAIVATLIAGLMLRPKKAPSPPPAPVASVLELLPQEVLDIEPVVLHQTLAVSGSLRAVAQASVKARVAGEVREVLVREGEAVQAGQVLVRMDGSDYQAKVDQARGALNAARAQQDIAAKTRDNNQALLEKGFISRNAFDNADSQYAVAQANVDSARGALDFVQKSLNDTTIRAPISGLIASRSVQPGEKVSADNRLLDIMNLASMELEAATPTSDITRVALGQPVSLRVEGLPDNFTGRVARINPGTQAGSRSVLVYIQVANPQGLLRSGMFAEAQLTLASKDNVLALPQSAIHKDSNGAYVYVIEGGEILRKPVRPGMTGRSDNRDMIEISAGLVSGEQVIKIDMGSLRSGTAARVAQPALIQDDNKAPR